MDAPLSNSGSDGSKETTETNKRDTEIEVEIPRRKFEVNTIYDKLYLKQNPDKRFIGNRITTSKYNCLTFLPKNLFEQFSKMANTYFLIMGLMEIYKPISDSNGYPVMLGPLSFVVGVSMIKDLIEDNARKTADREDNEKEVLCCPRGGKEFISMP